MYRVDGATSPRYPADRSVRSSMDRASDFGSDGWGFESLRARHGYAAAQLVPVKSARALMAAVGRAALIPSAPRARSSAYNS